MSTTKTGLEAQRLVHICRVREVVLTASLPAVQNMSADISPCSTIVATFLEGGASNQQTAQIKEVYGEA